MFPGSPARLHPCFALRCLLPLAEAVDPLGVWLRGCVRPQGIRFGGRHLLVSDDLGYLLRRCGWIALRDGGVARALPADVLVGCRVLEIVLATPYLPPAHQVHRLFPAARLREGVVAVPLGLGSPEEALALCASGELPVSGTRITYHGVGVDALPARSLG
jgi:hypothetical protein